MVRFTGTLGAGRTRMVVPPLANLMRDFPSVVLIDKNLPGYPVSETTLPNLWMPAREGSARPSHDEANESDSGHRPAVRRRELGEDTGRSAAVAADTGVGHLPMFCCMTRCLTGLLVKTEPAVVGTLEWSCRVWGI